MDIKERPILLKRHEVIAILEERQTQLRRLVKPKDLEWMDVHQGLRESDNEVCCPYGQTGDRLWVRETWMPDPSCDDDAWDNSAISYQQWDGCGMPMRDYPDALKTASNVIHRASWDGQEMVGWKPSIHMPRWASRILLEIVSVRVERLNEISESDAQAEGIELVGGAASVSPWRNYRKGEPGEMNLHCSTPQRSFMTLWESINGAGSWQTNPWVWVIEFRKI